MGFYQEAFLAFGADCFLGDELGHFPVGFGVEVGLRLLVDIQAGGGYFGGCADYDRE